MSSLHEMAECLEQSRTAADVLDRASGNGQVAAVACAAFVELAASFDKGGRVNG